MNELPIIAFVARRAFVVLVLIAACTLDCSAGTSYDKDGRKSVDSFLKRHCITCHATKKPKGDFRLDRIGNSAADVDKWSLILKRLEIGDMPPKGRPRPDSADVKRAISWIRAELKRLGRQPHGFRESAFPDKGNLVDHAALFDRPSTAKPATNSRIWRLSPFGYRASVERLFTPPPDKRRRRRNGNRNKQSAIVLPFGLTADPGFRDYAFRYKVSGSETQQMVLNARLALSYVLQRRGRWHPPRVLAEIATAESAPSTQQVQAAVEYLFEQVLCRKPDADERKRYVAFAQRNLKRFGNRKGLIHGLTPVLLHPEAVFRVEQGAGKPDKYGRVMLAPLELAMSISYALTDNRPDKQLLADARAGQLKTAADVKRHVLRILNDPETKKPRILRFFREYFGYAAAPDVFKDESEIKKAKIGRKYYPQSLVADTDRLVEYFVEKDRNVFYELLTTDKSFVGSDKIEHWLKFKNRREKQAKEKGVKPATHPFSKKNSLYKHYSFDPDKWSVEMPFQLPRDKRAGILTQPAWLIAHSANTDNHAIHRGKWIRERLLGGHIPDTPITVEAKLPDEPNTTLRYRMRVTRVAYCWKCHRAMDPLGLPFEMFDHFGQHRTTELNRPVNTSGEIFDAGEKSLDGPVGNALEMIRRLAKSKRVEQVFVRHAFRYWMGRNETLEDAPTLQNAYAAYKQSGGSMKALIASLLTSDSFLMRRVERVETTKNQKKAKKHDD